MIRKESDFRIGYHKIISSAPVKEGLTILLCGVLDRKDFVIYEETYRDGYRLSYYCEPVFGLDGRNVPCKMVHNGKIFLAYRKTESLDSNPELKKENNKLLIAFGGL